MTVSDFPNSFPAITLDFRNSQKLDPRITLTRATGGTYIRNGLVVNAALNVPRFQQGQGLLIETNSTNFLQRSQEIGVAPWTTSNGATITANSTVAPDGTTTADTLDAGQQGSYAQQTIPFTAAGDWTVSLFMRAGTSTQSKVYIVRNGSQVNGLNVDWDANGVPTISGEQNSTGSVELVGGAWYRIIMQMDNITIGNPNNLRIEPDFASGTGDVIVWGVQAEQNTFATSYILNVNTVGGVTRAIDNVSIPVGEDFNGWWSQGPGTFVTNACRITGSSAQNCVISVTDGGAQNRLEIRSRELTDTDTRYFLTGTNLGVFDVSSLASNQDVRLQALTYGPTNGQAALNGESDGNSIGNNLTGVPVLTNVFFGNNNFAFQNRPQYISNMSYYPVRVSDEELEALTS